jgi:murein tripeptide amidase MpaA
VIGHSGEGRPLVVVRVGSGRPGRPAVFVEGGIHAREWISPAAVTFMVDQLVSQPANRDLLDYYDFYFLPVTNPDG